MEVDLGCEMIPYRVLRDHDCLCVLCNVDLKDLYEQYRMVASCEATVAWLF